MNEIYGIPIEGMPIYHQNYLMQIFSNREKTSSRVKELQSAIIFFTNHKEPQDIGREWRNKYAKDVNISVIINTLKIIGAWLQIPPHRICKTAYPIFVYISHYYPILEPYLKTFQCVETCKAPTNSISDPFLYAENFVCQNGYTQESIAYAALILAGGIKAQQNARIEYVTCIQKPESGIPYFIIFKKESNKIIALGKEDIVHSKGLVLPSIQTQIVKESSTYLPKIIGITQIPKMLTIDNLLNHTPDPITILRLDLF